MLVRARRSAARVSAHAFCGKAKSEWQGNRAVLEARNAAGATYQDEMTLGLRAQPLRVFHDLDVSATLVMKQRSVGTMSIIVLTLRANGDFDDPVFTTFKQPVGFHNLRQIIRVG